MFLGIGCLNNKFHFFEMQRRPEITQEGKLNNMAKFVAITTTSDFFIAITSIVLLILKATGTLNLPPAAAYTFIGLTGIVLLSWIILMILTKGTICKDALTVVRFAFSSDRTPRVLVE